MVEEVVDRPSGATLVRPTPQPDPEGLEALRRFAEEYPGIRVISSLLSVQAYREVLPGVVIGVVTTPESSRKPPAEKRCFRDKWSC